MPSPPSSVIVLDDSSDEDAAATGRRSAPLLVSSSDDESDGGRPSQDKKPPTFSFTAAASDRKGMSNGSDSKNEGEPSEAESDTSDQSVARGKKKATKKKKGGAVGAYSATPDSDEDSVKETNQLRFADGDGRMFSDVMSFSELQAQQREFERLRAKAHRATKAAPHNAARRTSATGTKRKASEAVATSYDSPHSKKKGSFMKKTTSPSPFDFDFPGSSDESSSSSSPDENRAAVLGGARAKPMSLKDVVAQERELARLRNPPTKKNTSTLPKTKKKKAEPKQPQFSFGARNGDNVIDGTEWSSCELTDEGGDDNVEKYKPEESYEPEPRLNGSSSESDTEKISDEEYMPSKPKQHAKSSALPAPASHQKIKPENASKGKKAVQSNKLSSKRKKGKNKSRSSSAKSLAHTTTPAQIQVVSDTLNHRRNATDSVMHATVWRNVYFDTAPLNLLPLESKTALPFASEFDRSLLTYDVDGNLRSKCKLVPQFGKSTQFTLDNTESEQGFTQEAMDSHVTEVIQRELPRIRACHQRKTSAIIAEARTKVKMYLGARETHQKQAHHSQVEAKRLGDVPALDKSLLNQMKQEKLTQALSLGYSNVWGETISVEERLFPQDVNQLPCIRPMSRSTAYVGVKANVRVEDDPILRYKPYFGDNDDGADIDVAWYDAVESKDTTNISSGLDGEVNEFLLRLVVRECGTSDKVFSALKKVPGFAQAYSDYSEIKKLDDSVRLAARRLKEAKVLISTNTAEFPLAKVATLEPALNSLEDFQKTLEERFAPPPTYFDSNLARGHTSRGYGLGVRSTDDYTELLVTYRDMFCRICYVYHCVEHGIEHPLPTHRVDPINPPIFLSPVAFEANAKREHAESLDSLNQTPESSVSTVSPPASADCTDESMKQKNSHSPNDDVRTDEDVAMENGSSETCYETATDEEVATSGDLQETRRSSRSLTRISSLASRSLTKQASRPSRRKASQPHRVQLYPQIPDESEHLDDSHYDMVTAIVKKSLQGNTKCSDECWKTENPSAVADDAIAEMKSDLLSDTELVLLRKLRAIIGDNPCIISSMIKSTTCKEVGAFLKSERQSKPVRTSSMDEMPLSPDARLNHNGRKRGRARNSRSSNNRILLNRTRNNRLKDKGANHEYEPCNHEGACDTNDCSCMTRDHTCDKACSCSRDCPNRFPGCKCSLGNCRTKACPCFVAARECNPDLCFTCGASEVPALIFDEERRNMSALDLGICCNVNILRGLHKKIGVAYSTTHGWGAFAMEPIKRGEFIYEYHGALLSQDEAERRGSIYDKMTISFLFDVDDDSVVDAIRKGNKSKFANHSAANQKCKGKVLTVAGGEHRISIWAQQDIAKGEELFFDYGYHGETAPDWSQLRIKGSARHGPKKRSEGGDTKENHQG